MQCAAARQAFQGRDLPAGAALHQREAGELRCAIDDDGAGAACALMTAGLGAVEAELVAQGRKQSRTAVDELILLLAVDGELDGDLGHVSLPSGAEQALQMNG